MESAIKWFEIPVGNLARAKAFYEEVFNLNLFEFQPNDNLKMALFPDQGGVSGALCQYESFYRPGYEGPLVYLNADPDLQTVLDRLQNKKGKIIVPKTLITEDRGFMAVIEDSEGNRIGMMSEK